MSSSMKIRLFVSVFVLACVFAFLAGLVGALDVKVYDKDMFEIDAFGVGNKVIVKVLSDDVPSLSISEDGAIEGNVFKGEMPNIDKSNKSIYEYSFEPKKEATYNVRVDAGNESVNKQIFISGSVDINWTSVEKEFIVAKNESIGNQFTETENKSNVSSGSENGSVENASVKLALTFSKEKPSFFSRFIDWLKKGREGMR